LRRPALSESNDVRTTLLEHAAGLGGACSFRWRHLSADPTADRVCFHLVLPVCAVLIKGGVWKNTEDEILKAAVMK
jgi:hypothetical protein